MTALLPIRSDEEEVLAANRAFYAALHSLDLARMEEIWLQEDWVKCLHPGWELLMGWDEIRRSWEAIFQSTSQMMISVSRPLVHLAGEIAWVSCLEDVTTASRDSLSTALVEALNIFARRDNRWFLVHRHTSPVAANRPDAFTTVQ